MAKQGWVNLRSSIEEFGKVWAERLSQGQNNRH